MLNSQRQWPKGDLATGSSSKAESDGDHECDMWEPNSLGVGLQLSLADGAAPAKQLLNSRITDKQK
ncbi:hypothetical protein BCV70DRAFT_203208 [Testicularia cyperi]|uniref:Uncharacterized protein n=1 Tax=Testicularia cyperi TaxID=1882483 RepID=A0A317XFJ2_9BASI|nr:hypothetical protein BCV70DRAFT_203208 [Testicularia cyperi]